MDILDILVKLRDDLKTWVTNNILALKEEIDRNKFSGDYNDLENKPVIPTADELLSDEQKAQISTAYSHSQAEHAPADAQKNSDITQEEIEAKLTGTIYTHNHSRITFDTNAANSAGTVLNGSSLPKDFDRGIQCTFSENQTNNFFNNMSHSVVETIKPYGSIGKGTVAHQWIFPYKNEAAHRNKIYTRSILLGQSEWGEYAELYTSLNKPTPEGIGAVSSDDFVLATDDDIRALFTTTTETNIEDENNPESNNNIE